VFEKKLGVRKLTPYGVTLFVLSMLINLPAHASGGGEVLFLMFGAFALLPFAILGPIFALVGYASAPEDKPSAARTRAAVGALVAYVISYIIIYVWLVVAS
jgi:hypothetical protein